MGITHSALTAWAVKATLCALLAAVSPQPAGAEQSARIRWLQCSSALPDESERYRYGPEQAFDGDTKTAWNEGSSGGAGAFLKVGLDADIEADAVEIMAGYFDERYFEKNNRVRELEIRIGGWRKTFLLRDAMEAQRLELPGLRRFSYVTLTIRSTYRGSEWNDTCIAEVAFYRGGEKVRLVLPGTGGEPSADLVGRWQDSPQMAAGWGRNYSFRSDGTYYYETFEGGPAHGGTWMASPGRLVLRTRFEIDLEGGRLGPAGTPIGAERIRKDIDPPRQRVLALSAITLEPGPASAKLPALRIGEDRYWLMGDPLPAPREADLLEAAKKGDAGAVRSLLAAGTDADARDNIGYTPLIRAAGEGYLEIVRMLLYAGADPNATVDNASASLNGTTALHYAALFGHAAVAALLVDRGANLDVWDGNGESPLMMAAMRGHTEIVRAFVEAGADIALKERRGYTALILTAGSWGKDLPEVLEILVAAGADVNAAGSDGRTALMAAASSGHPRSVELLIGAGADVDAMDREGRTALALAERGGAVAKNPAGHSEAGALLRSAGVEE